MKSFYITFLFIYGSFNYAVSISDFIARNELKGIKKKFSWPNQSYYPVSCLQGLRKTKVSQDNQCSGKESDSASLEQKLEALPLP